MDAPQQAKYQPLALVEVQSDFVMIKQGDKESLNDYLNQFKSKVEVVKCLFGKCTMDSYAKSKDEFKDAAKRGCKEKR